MSFLSILQAIFSFRTGSTTVLASLLYLGLFVSVYITQLGQPVPSTDAQRALGLDLERAYQDLHVIAERPRPFNSLQNDAIRDFLLQRINEVAKESDFVHVDGDLESAGVFMDSAKAVYFEGLNILVKVDGSDEETEGDGVLFSAHFDSVSTAPGATDDGMSVAALLQMIEYLAENRPRRTAIFNINNGEEDGLHGAHMFLRHPWSNLTSTFLNLEGAGSGGRPFLFRATSYAVLSAFRSIPHIHADALSQDAWNRGVIRSDTDYSVYSAPRTALVNGSGHGYHGLGGGMQGADVAFYQGRSRYHTMEDSVRGMGRRGGRKSLWAMMELVRTAGDNLLNRNTDDLDAVDTSESAAYFELFGRYLVAVRLRTLLLASTILLSAGPVLLAGLAFVLLRKPANASVRARWRTGWRGYGRFWLALLLGVGGQVGLVVGFLKINPNTAHSHILAVSLSMLTLAYLSLAVPLKLAQHVRPVPPSKQRFIVLSELYALTWLFLLGSTILTERIKIAGLYWIPLWNASLLVAVVLGLFEALWGTGKAGRIILPRHEDTSDADDTDDSEENPAPRRRQEGGEASETTPLLAQRTVVTPPRSLLLDEMVQDQAYFWWIFQLVISAAVPLINLATVFAIWVASMPQTTPDGGWVGIVYAPVAFLSTLLLLPLAPFIHKMHRVLTLAIFVVFLTSTAYAWLANPFTPATRLKIFFSHQAELANLTAENTRPALVHASTRLTQIDGYGARLARALPSSWDAEDGVQCESGKIRAGLTTCAWALPDVLLPSPPRADYTTEANNATWLVARVRRTGPAALRVEVAGAGTRACRVHVDGAHQIARFRARTAGGAWSALLDVPDGTASRLLTLWARAWDAAFEAELELAGGDGDAEAPIEGRVACVWNDGPGGARLPALEEARAFLPEWVAITKMDDGLVEAAAAFSV
ncbi:hypothetical protein BC834DRAFT_884353 [Gloeopeniophorella convolvens]|nr:hypothetical protein BC834DRAFT_884353 [Gloeopeniophorella convolvens]